MTLAIGLGDCLLTVVHAQQKRRVPVEPPSPLPAEEAWTITLPSPPAAAGGLDAQAVYIPLQGGEVIALARETGLRLWSQPIASAWPPLPVGDRVFVTTGDELLALAVDSGEITWRVPLPAGVDAPLRLAGDRLILPGRDHTITALRPIDGTSLWTQSLSGAPGPMLVNANQSGIFIALPDARVMALSPHDGRVVWQRTLAGTLSVPAIGKDRVFVGSNNNMFYALDPDTGRLEWKWQFGGDVIGAAVDQDRVYVASLDNLVRGLNRGSGNQRWKTEARARPAAPPEVAGGTVILTGLSMLTAYNARTGAAAGTYDAPAELQGGALIDPVLLPFRVAIVAITRGGVVSGLRPASMLFREAAPAPLMDVPGVKLRRDALP